ncbi:hypothetical protein [Acinetobacter schindleri]|uniref:hypothetical protein n=1 Tax=Acinetobacter schindleri TaxID=108981 RepID=UPI00289FC62B|nr:hypothetical protein [Acinetobacter schindleri]
MIELLKRDVNKFFEGLKSVPKDEFQLEILSLFPIACCEYSSILLARFLIEKRNYNPFQILMLTGQCKINHEQLHLWLKIDDVTVDITVGQFKDAQQQIILTRDSKWHQRFKVINRCFPDTDFECYRGDFNEPVLENDYVRILEKINLSEMQL